MRYSEFDKFADDQFSKCHNLLKSKGVEYSRNDDRFHNFRKISRLTGDTPYKSLLNLSSKQIISVIDMVNDLDQDVYHSVDQWNEKINDVINYMVLLLGLIQSDKKIE